MDLAPWTPHTLAGPGLPPTPWDLGAHVGMRPARPPVPSSAIIAERFTAFWPPRRLPFTTPAAPVACDLALEAPSPSLQTPLLPTPWPSPHGLQPVTFIPCILPVARHVGSCHAGPCTYALVFVLLPIHPVTLAAARRHILFVLLPRGGSSFRGGGEEGRTDFLRLPPSFLQDGNRGCPRVPPCLC